METLTNIPDAKFHIHGLEVSRPFKKIEMLGGYVLYMFQDETQSPICLPSEFS
jgi:hypothetical protein